MPWWLGLPTTMRLNMSVPIKATMEKVPGGMMLIPLLIGALLATFAPGSAAFFGSFTGALFTGGTTILAVFYVCMGASIDIKATPYILKKGGVLFGSKVLFAVIVGIVAGRFRGELPIDRGLLSGLSVLAILAALNDTNGGMYMALMGQYGKPKDVAAYSLMSLESGPFLTMLTLGVAGLSAFPWPAMLGAILPLLVGMLLGNLDPTMREFLSRGVPVLIPFFAFTLGTPIAASRVWQAGALGGLLGLFTVAFTGTI